MGQAPPRWFPRLVAAVARRRHPRHCRTGHRAGGRYTPSATLAPGTGRTARSRATAAGTASAQAPPHRRVRPRPPAAPAPTPPVSASRGVSGLAQTGGACSVQRGRDLQLRVELINLSGAAVTLGEVRSILPLGGLRPVEQWGPCGEISLSWQATEVAVVFLSKASTGAGSGGEARRSRPAATAPPGSASPSACSWRARFRCRCSSASATRKTVEPAPRSCRDSRTWVTSRTPDASRLDPRPRQTSQHLFNVGAPGAPPVRRSKSICPNVL